MPEPSSRLRDRPEAARAGYAGSVLGSAEATCPGCGGPMAPGRKACSGKCRAALSRLKKVKALSARDDRIRASLEAIVRVAQEALARLDNHP